MLDKWRIPTIMELSILLAKYQFQSDQQIWSLTANPITIYGITHEEYWTASKSTKFSEIKYQSVKPQIKKVCMLVMTQRRSLLWSGRHLNYTFIKAKELCENVADSAIVHYHTVKSEVCDDRKMENTIIS